MPIDFEPGVIGIAACVTGAFCCGIGLALIPRSWPRPMARPTLIVFARTPAIGVGKTRLAADIGRVEAWRVYRALSHKVLHQVRDPRWQTVVRLAGKGRPNGWSAGLRFEDQGRGDLGIRMQAAFRGHARGPVVIIGTDAPDATAHQIAKALKALPRYGAVLGPALDGGFWLIALSARRSLTVRLDKGIVWSSAQTLADTEAVLGPACSRIATLADIDTGEDLKAWRRR
jgi:rSAM/selenodomain-associated transferase 1